MVSYIELREMLKQYLREDDLTSILAMLYGVLVELKAEEARKNK